jgi:hypothetical protein
MIVLQDYKSFDMSQCVKFERGCCCLQELGRDIKVRLRLMRK